MNDGILAAMKRMQMAALVVTILAFVGCAIGYGASPSHFFQSYYCGFILWFCVTMGCLGLLCLHNSIRGRWTMPILRFLEAGSSNLWLMILLFIPAIVGMHYIYPWTTPEAAADPALQAKLHFLNPTFFLIRMAVYFLIWLFLAFKLIGSSLRQDETGNTKEADMRANIGSPGILFFVITFTLASTDLVMSLDLHWYSTIWGFLFTVGACLGALSLCTIIFLLLRNQKPFSEVITPRVTKDLGNMLFTFTMFWGYINLSQFLIIYAGNIPEETSYYINRLTGNWHTVGTFVVFGQFFLPFLLLLAPRVKRFGASLLAVAMWIFFVRIIDIFWIVVPFFHMRGGITAANAQGGAVTPFFHTHVSETPNDLIWMSACAIIGIGGLWMFFFLMRAQKHPLMAKHYTAAPQETLEHA